MKFPHARSQILRRRILVTAVACCFHPLAALANPVGPVVTYGQASFSSQGNALTVTNSPGSIINWQGFSIGASEVTRFVQQNAASAVLNRVVGGQSSSILGALQSNGRVFLINPNGIIFGAGAQIDTAGLIASTLNIMDADFLSGKLRFGQTPDARSITNAGAIRTPAGGRVMLIAPQGVSNTGIIDAPNGEVILAAGRTVELTDSANPEVRVEVSAPDAQAINLGRIVAESGKVGIYGGLVANHGVVNADSAVVGENGRIVFRATKDVTLAAGSVASASGASGGSVEANAGGTTLVAGTVRATGEAGRGGEVKLLGERVGLIEAGNVDASGTLGGGTVLVGGDLQGANPAIRNARQTYTGAGTTIRADAATEGDGGKVVVWADDTTRSYGSISARGGSHGGDGGFVETSGKGGLDVHSGPDVRAPSGQAGTWLLDPVDLTVVAGNELDLALNSGAPFFAPLAQSSRIGANVINAQLDFGSNVILTTKSRGTSAGAQQGNITVDAPIAKSASSQPGGPSIGTTSLTLQAHNDIVITPNGSITSTGDPLTVNLTANSDYAGGGGITIGGAVTTRGGSFTATGQDAIAINAPISTMNATGTSGGTVQITSQAGAITTSGTISAGYTQLTGSGGVSVSAPIAATSTINITSGSGASTIGANLSSSGSSISISGATGVRITNGSQITTPSWGSFSATVSGAGRALDIDAGATVTANSASLSADAMEIQGAVNASGGIDVTTYNDGRGMDLGTNTSGKLSLTQTELNNLKTTSSLYLYGSGQTTVSAPITFAQPNYVALRSAGDLVTSAGANLVSANDIDLSGDNLVLNGTTSGGNVTLSGNAMTIGNTVTSAGDIDVTARDYVPVNLGVAVKGTGSLDLTAAEINRFVTGAGGGVLTLGSTGTSLLTIRGPLAPTGTQTLVLASGDDIGQDPGATLTVPRLGIQSYGNVALGEANAVGTLAAALYTDTASLTFANAPGTALAVGTVGNSYSTIEGITAYYTSGANVYLQADALAITKPVWAGSGIVTLRPATSTLTVDLGGASVAGTKLGLGAADLAQIDASTLTIQADKVDISAPIEVTARTLAIAPLTQIAGPAARNLAIVSTKTGGADLELTNADIGNVTATELILGGATTGAITVQAPVSVPNSIGTLTLRSADQVSGVSVNAAMGAGTANFAFLTDTMALAAPVETTSGSILIAPNSAGRAIELGGSSNGKLVLGTSDVANYLSAPGGTLTIGSTNSGHIDVLDTLDLASASPRRFQDLSLISGGTITTDADGPIDVPGSITLNAPRITLGGQLQSVNSGNVSLVADRMDINATVKARNTDLVADRGVINIKPRTPRLITLGSNDLQVGSNLGLTSMEVANLQAQSVLLIGDTDNTRSIQIDPTVTDVITTSSPVLSLIGGPNDVNNTITQTGSAGKIIVAALAATARNAITLDQSNEIDTIAAASTYSGDINITHAASGPLNIGTVDGVAGLRTNVGDIRVRSDEINIDAPIDAGYGFRNATIVPLTPNQNVALGTKPSGTLGMNATELNRISAATLSIGDMASTGDIAVTDAVAFSGGVSNLKLSNQASKTTSVGAALTVQEGITFTTGALNIGAAVSAQTGAIQATADTMTITAPVSAGASISLSPRTAGRQIDVGGADVSGATLGLDATDLGNLSAGGTLSIGGPSSGDMSVTYAGGALAGNVSLVGDAVTFSSAFGVTGQLGVSANSLDVASNISGGTGVSIKTSTAGRNIALGSNPGSGALGLDTAELGRISTGAGGTLSFDTTGTLTTTAPLTFTSGSSLQIGAGTLTHSGGTLSAPLDITLRADTMTLGSDVASAGGGRILVASRTETYRSLNLGTNPAGSALGLTATEIGRLSTSGVVQFGDTQNTGSILVSQPISQPAGSSALVLAASGSITQSPGAIITADKLRLQTLGGISLSESNHVNTLAGSSSGSFSFSNGTALAVGSVDGQTGISDTNVTLRTDALEIAAPIGGSTVTLAPLTSGTQVSLGTETAGQLSITDAELDQISASTVFIGTAIAPNATGNINVNAAVDRASGALNLVTGAGKTVSVNAPLGSATTSNVTINTGLGGTANINAPIRSASQVQVYADTITTSQQGTAQSDTVRFQNNGNAGTVTINSPLTAGNWISIKTDSIAINAPLVTLGSSIQLAPYTSGVPISLGAETSGAFSLSSSELALLDTHTLSIGNNDAGALTINAPFSSSTLRQLTLYSSGDITQQPSAPIVLSYAVTDPQTGYVRPAATLNVMSYNGRVELGAGNDINNAVVGRAGGSGQNFVFNNLSPLRLQNLSLEFQFAPTGRVLFNSPAGGMVPASPTSIEQQQAIDAVLASIVKSSDTQSKADKDADASKEEDEKKDRETRKKEGKKSCN